tara:strand:+ start:460 stop:1017 length:558 start_codon:yes stop_codon:yes gene_type:complete
MQDMILGLDISTSKIGIALVDDEKVLLHSNLIKFKRKDLSLEEKTEHFMIVMDKYKSKGNIKYVYVEQPFIAFSGGKTTAHTMAKLQRFNGMCCYGLYCLYGSPPTLIQANKARGLCGIKIKRGEKAKGKVIEWATQTYPNDFTYDLTRHGNPKPGTDDMADAVVIATAGWKLVEEYNKNIDNSD